MRITGIKVLPVTIPRLKALKVAYATRTVYQGFLVQLGTDAGLHRPGRSGAQFRGVRGDPGGHRRGPGRHGAPGRGTATPWSAEALLARLEPWRRAHAAALAAFDTALWDLAGKAAGLPVRALLGGFRRAHPQRHDHRHPAPGGDRGRGPGHPGQRALRRDQAQAGPGPGPGRGPGAGGRGPWPARTSPCTWTPTRATTATAPCGCWRRWPPSGWTSWSSRCPPGIIEALKWVSDRSPMPVMADEAVHTPEDALELVRARACAMLNIKLQKVGGISRALDVLAIARAARPALPDRLHDRDPGGHHRRRPSGPGLARGDPCGPGRPRGPGLHAGGGQASGKRGTG